MNNSRYCFVLYFIINITLLSCKNRSTKIINEDTKLDLVNWQFKFDYIQNLDDNSVKTFNIKLSDSIITKDEIEFYKFESDNYFNYNLYFGVKNDTIFCYDSKIDFYDVFLILNKKEAQYLSRIGNDYRCELVKFNKIGNESFYLYDINIFDRNYDDVIHFSNYPDIVFKEFYISDLKGFLKIKFFDRKEKIYYVTPAPARLHRVVIK